MTSTITPPADEHDDVLGMGDDATLAFVVEQRRRQDAAAAEELRGVTRWADLHRVDRVGAAHPDILHSYAGQPILGLEGELRLAGEGAFAVDEFAVCELAAALAMSEPAARAYVGQSLELRDRLPRLFAAVMAGTLPAWKARQVAEQTIPVSAAAADYVDTHLAAFAHKMSLGRVLKAVDAAVLRHDPELAAERAARAAEHRGVWLEDRIDGTTAINAVTGTPDAHAFDQALSTVATTLGSLGDGDPHQVRRAKAIGVLADPQYALDLTATATVAGATRPVRVTGQGPTIHVHLHTDATHGVARVDTLGPRSVETVRQWLADLAPGSPIRLTPVVDLDDQISVDAYEAPDRVRDQVTERDQAGCRFPWCGRQGRFDLDHIDPYVPPDEGGPPGQTSTANLARLCRFHHRVKTHGRWHYRREPSGALLWNSPLGRVYAVDEDGTLPHS